MTDIHDDSTKNLLVKIDLLCREFRKQISCGESVFIENYISRVEIDVQTNLFSQLLEIEVNFRRIKGDAPRSSEYLGRFPQFANQIRRVFFESTKDSLDSQAELASDVVTHAQSLPNAPDNFNELTVTRDFAANHRLGDYRLIREIGRGGMGIVYEAVHVKTLNRVALKTLPLTADGYERNAERLFRFRNEFRRLAEINHPNLVGMQSLEVQENKWFFTMDLIDGEDFLRYVRPRGELDEQRLRSCTTQLALGIIELHRNRIVHRDLKPGNILVSKEGRVTILDFGLAAELKFASSVSKSAAFAGTAAYAAPEQVFGERTEASDWYAFGTVLFEAITGGLPFHSTDVRSLLRYKQETTPEKLEGRDTIPARLAKLVDGLLIREPERRWKTDEICELLEISETPASSKSKSDSGTSVSTAEEIDLQDKAFYEFENTLIGRENQLAELAALHAELLARRTPASAWISGKSGEGKSCLAQRFLNSLREKDGIVVLSGRCYERETVPFKAIDVIIDSLVHYLRRRSLSETKALLPHDIRMLTRLFPLLGRVRAVFDASTGDLSRLDSKQIRYRAFSALIDLFENIGRTTSIVVFIDDVQWADADSAEFWFQVLNSNKLLPLLFLASYRCDEESTSAFLTRWEALRRDSHTTLQMSQISVSNIPQSQCLDFVASRLGEIGPSARTKVIELYQASGGNPYFMEQMLESLDPTSGVFQPRTLEEVIAERLRRLPSEAKYVLQVISVAGQSINIVDAFTAADLPTINYAMLNQMQKERLVRTIGFDEQTKVDTYHDRIRESVVARLNANDRHLIHLQIGRVIESQCDFVGNLDQDAIGIGQLPVGMDSRIFDLAYHFRAAGEEYKTFLYSYLAGEYALSQFALVSAREHFMVAENLSVHQSKQIQYILKFRMGLTLIRLGEFEQGSDFLVAAIELASDPSEEWPVRLLQSQVYYRTRSVLTGIKAYESLLETLGIRIPKNRMMLWKQILLMLLALRFTSTQKQNRRQIDPMEERKLRIRSELLHLISYPYIFRDVHLSMWAVLMQYHSCRDRICSAEDISISLGDVGMMYGSIIGSAKKANKYLERSSEIAAASDDLAIQANATFLHGIHSYASSPQVSLSRLADAVELYEKIGDAWRLIFATYAVARVQSRIGMFEEAASNCERAFGMAVRSGAGWLALSVLEPWSMATRGNLPLAELSSYASSSVDSLPSLSNLELATARWHLFHNRREEALRAAEQSLKYVHQMHGFSFSTTNCLPMVVEAMRMSLEESGEQQQRSSLHRRYLSLSRTAVKITKRYGIDLPYALRERALALRSVGRNRQAHRAAFRSLHAAEQQGAVYEHAISLRVCGEIHALLRREGSQEYIDKADFELNRLRPHIERTVAATRRVVKQDTQ